MNSITQKYSGAPDDSEKVLKCPNCGSNEIYYYEGVSDQDRYYASVIDVNTGSPGDDVEICARMGRVDSVEDRTFYLCHVCMSSWNTWKQCKNDCLTLV